MSGTIFRSLQLYLDVWSDIWQGQFLGTFKYYGHFCGSTLQQGSLSTAAYSSVFFFFNLVRELMSEKPMGSIWKGAVLDYGICQSFCHPENIHILRWGA